MLLFIEVTAINNGLRWLMALANLIIVIWSLLWFKSFWCDYRRRRVNGPTIALIISFVARANFHGYLFIGFLYLTSPYVTSFKTLPLLIWGCASIIGIIVAYAGLQWNFAPDENEN